LPRVGKKSDKLHEKTKDLTAETQKKRREPQEDQMPEAGFFPAAFLLFLLSAFFLRLCGEVLVLAQAEYVQAVVPTGCLLS
jgi:hypothetical protein